MRKLSVIIPVWNEEKTIRELLHKVENISAPEWTMEVIIVDDASTDNTRRLLKQYEAKHILLYHQKNQGKGSAVKTGLSKATGDYILIQDADLEYNPEEIPRLLEKATHNTVVYGSRNIDTRGRKMMLIPRLGVWFITFEFNTLFRTNLTDLWTCYKLFPKEASIYFEAGHFESELSFTARLIKNGYSIIEVPISHRPRQFEEGKKIKYSDGFKGIWVILKEKFKN